MQLKTYTLISILIYLFSCSVIKKQEYYYNQIIIRNNTETALKNVVISVPQTQKVFSCSNIAPKGSCSNSFKKTKYQKNPITVSYIHQSRQIKQIDIIIDVPKSMDYTIPLGGVLEIKPDGKILTYFEQIK